MTVWEVIDRGLVLAWGGWLVWQIIKGDFQCKG